MPPRNNNLDGENVAGNFARNFRKTTPASLRAKRNAGIDGVLIRQDFRIARCVQAF